MRAMSNWGMVDRMKMPKVLMSDCQKKSSCNTRPKFSPPTQRSRVTTLIDVPSRWTGTSFRNVLKAISPL
jgi:hypothetical protein